MKSCPHLICMSIAIALSSSQNAVTSPQAMGLFELRYSGDCNKPILLRSACRKAARHLGLADTLVTRDVFGLGYKYLPPGCSVNGGRLYFNGNGKTEASCTGSGLCLCDCSSAVGSCSTLLPIFVTSGSCDDGAGITSSALCSAAAAVLGLSDMNAKSDVVINSAYYPPHCYVEDGELRLNQDGSNKGKCSVSDKCVCLSAGLVTTVTSTTTTTRGMYVLRTSGDPCPVAVTGGLSDCSLAAEELGLSPKDAVTDGQHGSLWDPPYCYFENGFLKYNGDGSNLGTCNLIDKCVCINSDFFGYIENAGMNFADDEQEFQRVPRLSCFNAARPTIDNYRSDLVTVDQCKSLCAERGGCVAINYYLDGVCASCGVPSRCYLIDSTIDTTCSWRSSSTADTYRKAVNGAACPASHPYRSTVASDCTHGSCPGGWMGPCCDKNPDRLCDNDCGTSCNDGRWLPPLQAYSRHASVHCDGQQGGKFIREPDECKRLCDESPECIAYDIVSNAGTARDLSDWCVTVFGSCKTVGHADWDHYAKSQAKWHEVLSSKSGMGDDDSTIATCPAGSTLTGCTCFSRWASCNGAKSNGNTCTAFNSLHGQGVYAQARCGHLPGAYGWEEVLSPMSGNGEATTATCPAGSTLTGCSCYSPWGYCSGAKSHSNSCQAYNRINACLRGGYSVCKFGVYAQARCGRLLGVSNWQDIISWRSGIMDNDPASVSCPWSSRLTSCNCHSPGATATHQVAPACDGAKSVGNTCTAYNKAGGNGVYAQARCGNQDSKCISHSCSFLDAVYTCDTLGDACSGFTCHEEDDSCFLSSGRSLRPNGTGVAYWKIEDFARPVWTTRTATTTDAVLLATSPGEEARGGWSTLWDLGYLILFHNACIPLFLICSGGYLQKWYGRSPGFMMNTFCCRCCLSWSEKSRDFNSTRIDHYCFTIFFLGAFIPALIIWHAVNTQLQVLYFTWCGLLSLGVVGIHCWRRRKCARPTLPRGASPSSHSLIGGDVSIHSPSSPHSAPSMHSPVRPGPPPPAMVGTSHWPAHADVPDAPVAPALASKEYPSYWTNADTIGHDVFDDMVYVKRTQHAKFMELMLETYRPISTQDRPCPNDSCSPTKGGCPCVQPDGDPGLPVGYHVHCVVRIEDSLMWKKYIARVREIQSKRAGEDIGTIRPALRSDLVTERHKDVFSRLPEVNEEYLWHGCFIRNGLSIAQDNFNISLAGLNTGTMYGQGLYLAESCTKADEYATDEPGGYYEGYFAMLLCRVCLGKFYYTTQRDPSAGDRFNNGRYDSTFGDREASVNTFREFVVYNTAQVYPEYLVVYARLHSERVPAPMRFQLEVPAHWTNCHRNPHTGSFQESHPVNDRVLQLLQRLVEKNTTKTVTVLSARRTECSALWLRYIDFKQQVQEREGSYPLPPMDRTVGGEPHTMKLLEMFEAAELNVPFFSNMESNMDEDAREFLLWHGTSRASAMDITRKGFFGKDDGGTDGGTFNRFGDGLYFSDKVDTSLAYSSEEDGLRCVLLCRVVCGDFDFTELRRDEDATSKARENGRDSVLAFHDRVETPMPGSSSGRRATHHGAPARQKVARKSVPKSGTFSASKTLTSNRSTMNGGTREFIALSANQVYPEFVLELRTAPTDNFKRISACELPHAHSPASPLHGSGSLRVKLKKVVPKRKAPHSGAKHERPDGLSPTAFSGIADDMQAIVTIQRKWRQKKKDG